MPNTTKRKRGVAELEQVRLPFPDPIGAPPRPPSTRYQGSKLKLIPWIMDSIKDLPFQTALDAFGGTGVVSYALKSLGKAVTYNDYLAFNRLIGTALVENQGTILTKDDVAFVLARHDDIAYDDFISRTFGGVFYTDDENAWLDITCQNITAITDPLKQAVAYYALFQSCIIKRPYNLFHRANLYMRLSEVTRSFGNKKTWDTPFAEHFHAFVEEANRHVFDSGVECVALRGDALATPGQYDLVYIDPPYINRTGTGVDYLDFYHFLEGIVDYANWQERIDRRRKHLPIRGEVSPWSSSDTICDAFRDLFARYHDSILVVSYRSDGTPSEQELVDMVKAVKTDVRVLRYGEYKYVLSTNNASQELLIIGT